MAVKEKENKATAFANWREIGGKYLLTNDFGHFVFLGEKDFEKWSSGTLPEKSKIHDELAKKGFVRNFMDFEKLAAQWREKNRFLYFGTGLHILVMTLRCNHRCSYCQSGAVSENEKNSDMSFKTAEASVNFAFQSPNSAITLEFQGGEPLLNWAVLKRTVKYARQREKASGKKLALALVSNFSLMDETKAEFLLKNEVSLCASLDGPKAVHDKNRPYPKGSSHAVTIKWLKYFQKRHDRQNGEYRIFKPSALLTVTKETLAFPEKIADEYLKLGLEDIFIRPMTPIGYAAKVWNRIGYDSGGFLKFYRKSLKHIIKLNRGGVRLREKNAAFLLEKIINRKDAGYLDLRQPCGAAIGQLAYDYDGNLYTCDEGRMAAREGNGIFKVGNVKNAYGKVMRAPSCKMCVLSSDLERQPMCFRCAYKPYCGVCPVYNYEAQNSVWGNTPNNERCALYMGMFDIVFEMLQNKKEGDILRKWAKT